MNKFAAMSAAVLFVICTTGCGNTAEQSDDLSAESTSAYVSVVADKTEVQDKYTTPAETKAETFITTLETSADVSIYETLETEREIQIHFNDETESVSSDNNYTNNNYTDNQPVEVPHPMPNIYGYTPAFYQLNSDEQTAYDEIVRGMFLLDDEIEISVQLDESQISKVYSAVLVNMEQQLYAPARKYVLMSYESTGKIHSVRPEYPYNMEELAFVESEVNSAAEKILSGLTAEMSKVDMIKHLHDSVILSCKYSADGQNSGNAYGALVEGRAVCEGYARAMAYLCRKAGINCEIISGTAKNVSHMWNMVEVDGKWYNIDLTWDDPVLSVDIDDYVSYAYFNVTDSFIKRTHTPDTSQFSYPVSYAADANYFVYYNKYISTAEQAYDVIYNGIAETLFNGGDSVFFRFDNQQVFDDSTALLFDDTWSGFFSIVDEYNQQNEPKIDKNNISVKKDVENYIIRIAF